ncbi:MAG: hypothetical protein LBT05_00140 [Planctomycetaceae bacterium]|jgi:hypothetical protein|nr:hypothetical protein [Planctomycetaceae bacterium]
MLNELYALSQAISGAGIEQSINWHRQLKELPNGTCFRVWIATDGSIAGIEEIEEMKKKLRKYEPNNGVSFPCFNMPLLYAFSQTEDKKETQKLKKEKSDKIKKWQDGKENFDFNTVKDWYMQDKTDWNQKVSDKPGSPLIGKKVEDCFAIMSNLAERYAAETNSLLILVRLLKNISFSQFRENLETYILDKLQQGTDLKALLKFLFADKPMQIFPDLKDWKSFGYPVANEKTMQWLNNILYISGQTGDSDNKTTAGLSEDAFGGVADVREKMGGVKLPGLGEVRLRSMFKDHVCQLRYGKIEDESFLIGSEYRKAVKSALEWLADEKRKGTTWLLADSKEIVFAYPSTLPPIPIKFASMLGSSGGKNLQYEKETRFTNIAENVIDTLKGLSPDKRPKNIEIFSIRKMDKARSKVVFYRNYTTDRLYQAAEDWQQGCENLPPIMFRMWSEKTSDTKSVLKRVAPEVPFPLQVAAIANSVWKQDGSSAGKVPKFDYYQGIELLLEDDYAATEQYLLQTLISNTSGLIMFLGNYLHGNDKNGYQNVLDRKRFNDVVYLPFLFGLLLYKQKIYRKNYMETLPYLLGQMLKISDELHALYCLTVRNGDIPPQLAGNSIMQSAFETPHQAVALLGQRMTPYLAWAKQYRTKNIPEERQESWRANWLLQLYERTASKMIMDSAKRFNDLEKAQLFLGYLAEFPKKDKPQDNDTQTSLKQEGQSQ